MACTAAPRPPGRGAAAVLGPGPAAATATDPVEVVVPPGTRWSPGPGVVVRTARLDGDVVHDGRGRRRTYRVLRWSTTAPQPDPRDRLARALRPDEPPAPHRSQVSGGSCRGPQLISSGPPVSQCSAGNGGP